MNLAARQSYRPFLDVAIPGFYAWVVTVAWPLRGEVLEVWPYIFAATALLALGITAGLARSRFRHWSAVSVGMFITASATVWFLLGADVPSLGLLGSVGWAAFAVGWVRASGTREVDEGPTAFALELAPRRAIPWPALLALVLGVLGASGPLVLAWNIEGRERSLLGHALALLGALQTLSLASALTLTIGQSVDTDRMPWAALGRTLALAVLVAVGCWFTFS